MPDDRNQVTEFLSQLHEGLTEESTDVAAASRELEAQGIDVDRVVSEGLHLIDESKKRRRLMQARHRLDRIREAVSGWSGTVERSAEKVKTDIARALAGDGGEPAFQAYYRKLSSVDPTDLESLTEDEQLIDFIAEIVAKEEE